MFTNVGARYPQRKNKAVFLCNTFSWLNKSGFILFTFIKKGISDHTHLRVILLIFMQDKVIKVDHRLPLLSNSDVMAAALTAASVLFTGYSV